MDCIFNELSVQPVATVADAYSVMAQFIRAIGTVQPLGLRRIRIPEQLGKDLFSLPLAPSYAVGAWLNDDRVNHDLKDRFRLIVANPPLLTDDEVDELSLFGRSVFCLHAPAGTPEAKGFGAAHLADSLLTSLFTDAQWDTHQLPGWHWYLDQTGQEQTVSVTVRHFATSDHAEQHIPWLQQQQTDYLQRSADVWERRTEFFPNLVLCGEVKDQLKRIGVSSYLMQIINRLRTLDAFAAQWHTGAFNLDQLNAQTNLRVSGESPSTMRLYSARRKFKLPDGRRELFELHIKIGDLRFHFYPDSNEYKVYVGYIGVHLPTFTG